MALIITLSIIGLLLLISIITTWKTYNELVKERVLVQEGWSGVGTFLQQRLDLIPNLVETVKGYASHEKEILTTVAEMHSRGVAAINPNEQKEIAHGLSTALRSVFIIANNYPELKASKDFQMLQASLYQLEEDINNARRYYNGTVREYNQSRAVFPKVLIANTFGFKEEIFFQEDAEAKKAPRVNFSGN